MKLTVACVLALLSPALAQQSQYGGGTGYTGPTDCPTGWSCQDQNQWYSQCLPGSPSTSSASIPAPPPTSTVSIPSTTMITSTSTSASASSTSTTPAPPAGVVSTASGTSFVIDGQSQYFAGTNAYWIGFLTDNDDIDTVMSHIQSSGLKVLRVWGFNDVSTTPSEGTVWFQSFVSGSDPVINTGADGLQRLDYLVASAAAHDVKLIVNFVNNWDAYGGKPLYMTYYGVTEEQWFTSTAAQAQYQAYIQAVVSRYSSNPAIFAWELANEMRCHGCDTSVITNWATRTSAYIKSLDSSHMVTLGDEGWAPSAGDGSYPYTTAEGVDFAANLQVPDLDFGTFHLYPQSWGEDDAAGFGDAWIQAHGAACAAANKPCLLEEYGLTGDHAGEVTWQQTSLATSGMAGDMFWQDGDNISTGTTADDGFTIYYGSSDWTTLVTQHVAAIASSGR